MAHWQTTGAQSAARPARRRRPQWSRAASTQDSHAPGHLALGGRNWAGQRAQSRQTRPAGRPAPGEQQQAKREATIGIARLLAILARSRLAAQLLPPSRRSSLAVLRQSRNHERTKSFCALERLDAKHLDAKHGTEMPSAYRCQALRCQVRCGESTSRPATPAVAGPHGRAAPARRPASSLPPSTAQSGPPLTPRATSRCSQ